MQPDTVKVGMIRTTETLAVVVDALLKYRPHHIIYDPIVTASNGDRLLSDDVITQIRAAYYLCVRLSSCGRGRTGEKSLTVLR